MRQLNQSFTGLRTSTHTKTEHSTSNVPTVKKKNFQYTHTHIYIYMNFYIDIVNKITQYITKTAKYNTLKNTMSVYSQQEL